MPEIPRLVAANGCQIEALHDGGCEALWLHTRLFEVRGGAPRLARLRFSQADIPVWQK
jgi:hypothetical protein